jgi:hypothetical protein
MKKTLLFVAMTVLILNASGCGACRNGLFARRATTAPMVGHVQQPMCQPMCQPVCCPQPCCDPCGGGATPMTVGFDGGGMMMEGDSGCACGQ